MTQVGQRSTCLGCDRRLPAPFLDLGRSPLANRLVRPGDEARPEPVYPLAVARCEGCHLVQSTYVVPPEELFADYPYFSSFSNDTVEHAAGMASELTSSFGLGPASRVLEIGSNDGYLLREFQRAGVRVLGVEPARNVAAVALERGVPTLERFFGPDALADVTAGLGAPDLIVGNNVLAHAPDNRGFLATVRDCLAMGGAAVFETPWLAELLAKTQFDTIYHEHVYHYSLTALRFLARGAGLEIFDVQLHPIHGGTMRVLLGHEGRHRVTDAVTSLLAREEREGLTEPDRFLEFQAAVTRRCERLVAMLQDLRESGRQVAAYGAPAKGSVLLNACGIGTDLIEFTVDRSPHKQGMLMPGSHIPILAPETLLERMPDYAVILPWNIVSEIRSQQAEFVRRGGRFIVPVCDPFLLE